MSSKDTKVGKLIQKRIDAMSDVVTPKECTLLLEDAGHEEAYQGIRSYSKKTILVGRRWSVFAPDDNEPIGEIRYRMIVREQRSRGMRYVNRRWHSPGWEYRARGERGWFERPSRTACVTSLLFIYRRT